MKIWLAGEGTEPQRMVLTEKHRKKGNESFEDSEVVKGHVHGSRDLRLRLGRWWQFPLAQSGKAESFAHHNLNTL